MSEYRNKKEQDDCALMLDQNDLKLSVIATVRNESGIIKEFIDSLLNQSYMPDEIIIVDGNSTDGTHEILTEYASKGHINLYSEDCNIAQGRNIGIEGARNEYIAITDAGCNVDREWLYHIAQCFSSEEQPEVVAGNFKFDCHSDFEEAVVLATFNPAREDTDQAKYYPSSRSLAVKKSAWKEAKGYPEWLYAAEDTLFNIRLRQLGKKFVFCRDAIVRWRPRSTWGALAKQRYNFAIGNARVGIGTQGYKINIIYHLLIIIPLILSFIWPVLLLLSLIMIILHLRKHLWRQAKHAGKSSDKKWMTVRVLLVMEWTRLVGIAGFIRGRMDRIQDKTFVSEQIKWMGVSSLDEIDIQ